MFRSSLLENKLKYSHSIDNNQEIWAEWNLNQSYNIHKIGNYRYRPGSTDADLKNIKSQYDELDVGNYYTGATDADIVINAGFDDADNAAYYITPKKKINLLYSLEDCFKQNRPRSGINKLMYLGIFGGSSTYNQYIDSLNVFKKIKSKPITFAEKRVYSRNGNTLIDHYDIEEFPQSVPVPVIKYMCQNDFSINESVKIQDIVVEGYASITIEQGESIGVFDQNASFSIYVGQRVLDNNFPSGTYIVSFSNNSITFSNEANESLVDELVNFSGTTSDFNFSTPKRIIDCSSTYFVVESNTSEIIHYASGGTAIYGYSATSNIARRPRYYMASRYDDFKYWTSYRTEVINNVTEERGISFNQDTGVENKSYYIHDAAPFVVYNEQVPTNRVVIKMQTNVGEINNGPFRMNNNPFFPDPLYGESNKSVPKRWAIQILDNTNNWTEVISFTENSKRKDKTAIIGSDGQVEIEYGLVIPDLFQDVFTFAGEITTISQRPDLAPYGYAYLYKESENDKGVLYISDGGSWIPYTPQYTWKVSEKDITKNTNVVRKLVDPDFYIDNGVKKFREFQLINGIRIVVDTMNKINSTFDLIELSPRIVANITDRVSNFSIKKIMSDLATTPMPTGTLLASTGELTIFDDDFAFNENNAFNPTTSKGSIVAKYSDTRVKFLFYDIVKNINLYDYYIPIKTLYSEKIPQVADTVSTINFTLRDFFFYLESKKSPEILLTDVSLSYAITVLLDSIGFTNYVFKRTEHDQELIIPYFFVGPNQNVAETLQQLAMSSQSSMFFDEYNDLVVMSKNYTLPATSDRPTDLILYGQEESVNGLTALPNIVNVASEEKQVYNGGEINYTNRYIQRSIGSIAQAPYIDEYKSYVYKPVLLWEVAGKENTKTINESVSSSSGYSLAAMPLKTTLSSSAPQIVDGTIINNIVDFGESVYWLGNYAGYFYANGEIIKYDAVEYFITGVGTVWITNNQEYQNYFGKLKFNGKIYPTGNVRIYTNIDGTIVKEHGRAQFGTEAKTHHAGISDSSWVNNDNVKGCIQNATEYLFNTKKEIYYPQNTGVDLSGNQKNVNGQIYNANTYAAMSTRNGIIKNFMANTNITENEVNHYSAARSGSIQSSALVFNGPVLPSAIDSSNFVTYVYKTLDRPYRHFGTRIRIVGKIESGTNRDQSPIGAFPIYPTSEVSSGDPSKQITISGGGGGIAFGLNKDTNVGYYFEITALTENIVSSYTNNSSYYQYDVSTDPKTKVENDTVTVYLSKQHDFEIGTTVEVLAMIDDNDKINETRINGEFTVTDISQDRKAFKYKIYSPTTTTASISKAEADGFKIVYTAANHKFSVGQKVTITGMSNSSFNLVNVPITGVTEEYTIGEETFHATFTVATDSVSGILTSQSGTATYQSLTTTSSSGGTVTKNTSDDAQISNMFFYKVVSGFNTADIVQKQRSGNVVTLTTLKDHSFYKNDQITVSGVDSNLNGTYSISEVGPRSIQYTTTTSGNISQQDLSVLGSATGLEKIAIPQIIWRGFSEIIIDDGKFTTQSRLSSSEKTTVYDLAAEYVDVGTSKEFYLYLNNKQIAIVRDDNPIPQYNNIATFVRGSSRVMFENIYALSDNFSESISRRLQLPVSQNNISAENDVIKNYALNGIIQSTYLSGITSEADPQYQLYYEEFGTIMREASYFNIKYDRAYPALYAKLAPVLNRVKAYSTSGFIAGSYGAEFLIFNITDKNINLDDTSGNYLKILGIAFTQNTTHSLKVDDFFKKNSNFTNAIYSGAINTEEYKKLYNDIVNSRNKYGKNDFTIDTQYVQTDAAAESMMDWIIKKVISPRKTIGAITFGTPHLQLGDIVQVNYKRDGLNVLVNENDRFVVYSIEYQKSSGSIQTTVYLAEV